MIEPQAGQAPRVAPETVRSVAWQHGQAQVKPEWADGGAG
jgi:hypothetical protein